MTSNFIDLVLDKLEVGVLLILTTALQRSSNQHFIIREGTIAVHLNEVFVSGGIGEGGNFLGSSYSVLFLDGRSRLGRMSFHR